MKLAFIRKAIAARDAGRPAALATHLKSGLQLYVEGSEAEGDLALDETALAGVHLALADDRSTTLQTVGGPVFVEVFNPPLRLFLVGAVHIAQPLARMAAMTGYHVTVIDPRTAFATDERFPGVDLCSEWPDEALEKLQPNRRSAIVTLTHDPKLDDPALQVALKTDAFYIGALGSRKTHAKRCQRLIEAGFNDNIISRIHGPVGLDIGAISPAEISISVLAEITRVLHADRVKNKEAA